MDRGACRTTAHRVMKSQTQMGAHLCVHTHTDAHICKEALIEASPVLSTENIPRIQRT